MKKRIQPSTDFLELVVLGREGVAIPSGSGNLKALTKLCAKNVQKLPWKGL